MRTGLYLRYFLSRLALVVCYKIASFWAFDRRIRLALCDQVIMRGLSSFELMLWKFQISSSNWSGWGERRLKCPASRERCPFFCFLMPKSPPFCSALFHSEVSESVYSWFVGGKWAAPAAVSEFVASGSYVLIETAGASYIKRCLCWACSIC